jgi:hypothetical protein
MASITWDADVAEVYDETYAAMFEPSVLGPMTGLLTELARGAGAALPDPGFADDMEAVLADVGPTPDDPWARS